MSVISLYNDDVKAVKRILIGSEAIETDWKTNETLIENLDLSARFCQEEICRLVLNDLEQRGRQGPLLAYLSREYALAGNAPASREAFRRVQEKNRSRDQDGWNPEKDEVVAVVTGFYKNDGWKKAEKQLRALFRSYFQLFLKYELLKFRRAQRRLRTDKKHQARDEPAATLDRPACSSSGAEEKFRPKSLEDGLEALMDFNFGCINIGDLRKFERSKSRLLVDDLLFFAELCGRRGVDSGRIAELVGKILPRNERKNRACDANQTLSYRLLFQSGPSGKPRRKCCS